MSEKQQIDRSYSFWDGRYSTADYAYGTNANDYLQSVWGHIPPGRVLSLGEGEGRNAVFLAQQEYQVVAVDFSLVGLQKAIQLAHDHSVKINAIAVDLTTLCIKPVFWQGIISIYCHLVPPHRAEVHQKCVQGLVKGGIFILEAYSPRQLKYRTGGPSQLELLMELADVLKELRGLSFITAREIERDVYEGRYHRGKAAVIQILAKK